MMRIERRTDASPDAVFRAILAETDAVREPAEGHPNWKRRYSRVQARRTGNVFSIRFVTGWAVGDKPVPELRGSVAAQPDGTAVVHATCGYGWAEGDVVLGLLIAGFLVWAGRSSWIPWLAGMAGLLVLAGRVGSVRRADNPDRYMTYLIQRLDIALSVAAAEFVQAAEV